jgi:glycosyltransferase involved in cell wall biosynthesis
MSGNPPLQKLSLAMIVKNEARCLARCLRSVQKVADEIIVVDTGSTDRTVEIAGEYGAKIFHFDWCDDFSAARNFALFHATGDWMLVLDADETVSEPLVAEIKKFIHGPPQIGRLKIVSDFRRNGQTLRSQTFVSRLFPWGAHFEGKIHEQIISPLPRVNLAGELAHDGYLETQKSDRNVKLLRAALAHEPDNAYLLHQLALEYTSLDQPENAFACLQQAFARVQPADPFAPNVVVDLLYAAMAVKQFDAGLEAMARSEKNLAGFPDFHLARGLFYMNLIRNDTAKHISEVPKVEQSFQRCLALGETDRYKSVHGTGTFLANYNLGLFYHVFGNAAGAKSCLQSAVKAGYEPAIALLEKLKPSSRHTISTPPIRAAGAIKIASC